MDTTIVDPNSCHIYIGGDEIVGPPPNMVSEDDPQYAEIIREAQKKLDEKLKEVRVRIGTLLKLDNVSFLIGAGASIESGGISLASIPVSLEKLLFDEWKSHNGGGAADGWIRLFYDTLRHLNPGAPLMADRVQLLEQGNLKDDQAIGLNLEVYLSHLYAWQAALGTCTSIVIQAGGHDLTILGTNLRNLVAEIKRALVTLLHLPKSPAHESLRAHRRFLRRLLTRPLNLRRARVFTLNYDTLIEQAADAEGIVLVDGFVGVMRRILRPECYDTDYYFPAQTTEGRVHRFDRVIHLCKLHGSVTWHRCGEDYDNPFGVCASHCDCTSSADEVMIYPTPSKFGQALGMPYSELFKRLADAIVQPQSVLFVVGYGFGDDHVNAIIRQAMAVPSFTLVIVDPEPKSKFVTDLARQKDQRVWRIHGWNLGTFEHFVARLLPDLKEEEIDMKVIRTYKALQPEYRELDAESEETDGE